MKSTEIRDAALAKFSLSKLRTHVFSNLLYSSTQNCIKTIHSSKLYTTEQPPLLQLSHPKKISTKIQIYVWMCGKSFSGELFSTQPSQRWLDQWLWGGVCPRNNNADGAEGNSSPSTISVLSSGDSHVPWPNLRWLGCTITNIRTKLSLIQPTPQKHQ